MQNTSARKSIKPIYERTQAVFFDPAKEDMQNPYIVLGIEAAKDLRMHVERQVGRKFPEGISTLGGLVIVVDNNEDKDACFLMDNEYPMDTYWEKGI